MMRSFIGLLLFFSLGQVALFGQGEIAVINGARFEIRYPVSPGSYAQAYGTFAGVATVNASSIPLITELGGIRLLVNDVASPLVAVSADVISFVVPRSAAPGRVPVRVMRGADAVGQGTVDVLPVSPGVFFVLGDPLAQGGVLNQQNQYAIQASPARRGQAIQIYGTGQGAVDFEVPDGAAPPAGVLVNARGVTKVYVSGYEAAVGFSGLSPIYPGLWQINATLPDQPFLSGQTALIVTIDGVPSNQVSFWVAP